MLRKLATNLLLAVGTYTVITKTPHYVGDFVHGWKSAREGKSLDEAIASRKCAH